MLATDLSPSLRDAISEGGVIKLFRKSSSPARPIDRLRLHTSLLFLTFLLMASPAYASDFTILREIVWSFFIIVGVGTAFVVVFLTRTYRSPLKRALMIAITLTCWAAPTPNGFVYNPLPVEVLDFSEMDPDLWTIIAPVLFLLGSFIVCLLYVTFISPADQGDDLY
jgi:hypothetical protein